MTHPVVQFYMAAALKFNYWRSAKIEGFSSLSESVLTKIGMFLAGYVKSTVMLAAL